MQNKELQQNMIQWNELLNSMDVLKVNLLKLNDQLKIIKEQQQERHKHKIRRENSFNQF